MDIQEQIKALSKSSYRSGYLAALIDVSAEMEPTENNVQLIKNLVNKVALDV